MTKDDITKVTMARGEWNKVRAYVTVYFTNGLVVKGVKVISGMKGLFVGMPRVSKKDKETGNMKYEDCCLFDDKEDRAVFQKVVLDEYHSEGGSSSEGDTPSHFGSSGSSFYNRG